MLDAPATDEFVLKEEGWKRPLEGPIRPAVSKFQDLFDEAARGTINKGLNMGFFGVAEERLRKAPGRIWISEKAD